MPKPSKYRQNGSQNLCKIHEQSADPWFGRVRSSETFLPPTPLRPGPLAARRWAQFVYSHSIRILGPKFCAHGTNPATRGFSPLWDTFSLFLNLSELVPNFGRGRPFCTVLLPFYLGVQRALCTMKVAVINVQGSLCTSASGKGVRPHIHIGPCASLAVPDLLKYNSVGIEV